MLNVARIQQQGGVRGTLVVRTAIVDDRRGRLVCWWLEKDMLAPANPYLPS